MFYYLNCFPIFREGSSPAHSHHGSSPIIDPWIKSRIEIKKLILAHFYKKTRNYIFDRLYYESVFFFSFLSVSLQHMLWWTELCWTPNSIQVQVQLGNVGSKHELGNYDSPESILSYFSAKIFLVAL